MSKPTEAKPDPRGVAMVTGASSGIGRALCLSLARRGWDLALGARRPDALAESAALAEQCGVRTFSKTLDLQDVDSVDAFVEASSRELGSIRALINNAGVARVGPVAAQSREEIREVLETNLLGPILTSRAVIRSWSQPESGRALVFVSSSQAARPIPHLLPYGASKLALEYLADGLRLELEAQAVRVVTARIGPVETPFRSHFETDRTAAMVEAWQTAGVALPRRQRMDPDRVADAIADSLDTRESPYLERLELNP